MLIEKENIISEKNILLTEKDQQLAEKESIINVLLKKIKSENKLRITDCQ